MTRESPIERDTVLILGASTRAAAFSVLRAGMNPVCADLFADMDLTQHAPVTRVAGADYPEGLRLAASLSPPGPWLYVGGLENHPQLVADIAAMRPLWGNGPEVLRRVRDPFQVSECLARAGLPCPQVRRLEDSPPKTCDWLVKPIHGAGGRGITEVRGQKSEVGGLQSDASNQQSAIYNLHPTLIAGSVVSQPYYLQQKIDGPSYSATFAADGARACLVGLTRQLVGEADFHAKPFHYCGSIGPIRINQRLHADLLHLGQVLAAEFGLCGLFGIDGILANGDFWPVEINPRYTASVEILELEMSIPTLALHRAACTCGLNPTEVELACRHLPASDGMILGKVILFAPNNVVVPSLAGYLEKPLVFTSRWPVPPIADVPRPGDQFSAGQPICTVFARGDSVEDCRCALGNAARQVYGQLTSVAASSRIGACRSRERISY